MATRGIVGRALRTRWAALAAICALAVQSAGLPMTLKAEAAAPCSPHRTAEDVCGVE